MIKKAGLILLLIAGWSFSGNAWVFPEHRDIALLAIQKLDPHRRALLDRLWAVARQGHEQRLGPSVADATLNERPPYLDYAAWPAVAGDHSTSAGDMLHNILETDWIMDVADIAAKLKNGLEASTTRSQRAGKLRESDLRLLRADPEYVTRAGSNNVHFMLSRMSEHTSAASYFDSCFREGCEINLIGVYTWYHTSAMEKARWSTLEQLTPDQRSALVMSALADEAFGLHFLEDAFSSGHVAGIWGNAALRKGTHDYYDEHGLEVSTWKGDRMVLTGDAYMRPLDADRAANTVLISMNQFLDAFAAGPSELKVSPQQMVSRPDTFNIARAMNMAARPPDPEARELTEKVLVTLPVPGLIPGLGEIPRFRSEVGPFIGIQPGVKLPFYMGGFSPDQVTAGLVPGLEVAVHIGLGLDGVLNESGDGLVFLDLGWRLDGASTMKLGRDPGYKEFGSILSAIPSRTAFYGRLRLPYYVIPGDLLLVAPILYFASPKAMNNMVATAGAGGLIPWQTGMVTPLGRFQFILGREVGVCFYGSAGGADSYLANDPNNPGDLVLYSMHTTRLDFPILEYRPVRTFSRRQSMSLVMQFNAGLDIPGKVTMIEPAGMDPIHLKTTWFIGLRLAFDWRFYYAKKKTTKA